MDLRQPTSRSDLLEGGWDRARIDTALRRGELQVVRRGVYVGSASPPADVRASHLAAVRESLAGLPPGWHADRRSAAVLHGLPLLGQVPGTPQLLTGDAAAAARATDRHRRLADLPLSQRTTVEGLAAVTMARAAVDLARGESVRSGVVIVDAALRAGAARAELTAVLRGQRRWPGVVRARWLAEFCDGRSESPLESLSRLACVLERLPVPEPQVELWRYDELIARLDLYWADVQLALEADGALKFTDEGVLPALLARQERIRDCGVDVVRVGWSEVFRRTQPFGDRMRTRRVAASGRQLAPGVRLVSTVAPAPATSLIVNGPRAAA